MVYRTLALRGGWPALRLLPLAALVLLTSAFGLCEDDESPLERAIMDVEFRPILDASCSPRAEVSHGAPVKFTLRRGSDSSQRDFERREDAFGNEYYVETVNGEPRTSGYIEIYSVVVGKGKDRKVYYGPKGAADRGIEVVPDGSGITLTTTEDGPARTERIEVWVTLDYEYDRSADFEDQASGDARIPMGVICVADIVHSDPTDPSAPSPSPPAAPTATVVSAPPPDSGLTLETYPGEVRLGETLSLSGDGFTPNCPVTHTFTPPGGTPFSIESTADADGVVTATVDITSDQPTGAWIVTATDDTSGKQAQATFSVVP